MTSKAKKLQAKLIKEREKYGSDAEFARAVGVKEPTMYKWLKSTPVWPDYTNLQVIAKYFKTTPDKLIDGNTSVQESPGVYSYEYVSKLVRQLPPSDQLRISEDVAINVRKAMAV